MKRCPACGRTFTNATLIDCLNDGTPLVEDAPDTVSYYGAPMPASPEALSPFYPEDDPLDDEEEDPGADEETATAPAYPEPRFGQQPSLAAPPVTQGTPPPYFAAAQTRPARVPLRGLLVAGLIIFGILRFGLNIIHSQKSAAPSQDSAPVTATDTTPSTATDTTPDLLPGLKLDKTLTATPDSTLRQSLITAVKGADAAEAKSVSTLSPAPLRSFYAGPMLATELDRVQSLKKSGTRQDERLVAQRFKAFNVNPAHTKAEVDVAEQWKTITRSQAGGKATQKASADSSSQVVSLTHTPHGWIVQNIQFYEDPEQAK